MSAYYNEHDPFAAEWLSNLIKAGHIAPEEVDSRSILDVRPDDLAGFTQCHFFAGIGVWSYALRRAGWDDDRPVWTGSCPCQPFSAAGKGGGFDDERHLWPAWFHLIGVRGPGAIFGEQVSSDDGLAWLDLVQSDLEGAGYAFGALDSCAASVGAPHIRQRLWFVANAGRSRRREDARGSSRDEETDGRAGWIGQRSDGYHQPASYVADGIVADTDLNGRDQRRIGGTSAGHDGSIGNGAPIVLGDTSIPRPQGGEDGRGALQPQRAAAERAGGDVGGLADAECRGGAHAGRIGSSCDEEDCRRASDFDARICTIPSEGMPGPLNGFWRDADWLRCRDGKWRPVESGSSPLATGAASRVGRLRAYGNAICAEVAEAVIRSAMT